MAPWVLMTGMLAGGSLLGVLFGTSLDMSMKPAAGSTWRQRYQPRDSESTPPEFIEPAPQELTSFDPESRMPTWKRRAMAEAMRAATYIPPPIPDYEFTDLEPKPKRASHRPQRAAENLMDAQLAKDAAKRDGDPPEPIHWASDVDQQRLNWPADIAFAAALPPGSDNPGAK